MFEEEENDEVGSYDPIPISEVHLEMLQNDPEYRAAHARNAPKYALIKAMLDARDEKGLTLEQIASQMGTTKSALSRMLSGRQTPNWKTVSRFAEALGKEPVIRFIDKAP